MIGLFTTSPRRNSPPASVALKLTRVTFGELQLLPAAPLKNLNQAKLFKFLVNRKPIIAKDRGNGSNFTEEYQIFMQ